MSSSCPHTSTLKIIVTYGTQDLVSFIVITDCPSYTVVDCRRASFPLAPPVSGTNYRATSRLKSAPFLRVFCSRLVLRPTFSTHLLPPGLSVVPEKLTYIIIVH